MATTTTLRPSSLSSGSGWSAVPSGTLYGVTSDDSDSTYALWSGSGSALILATPSDEPPAGERRHAARLRIRGEDGDIWGAVRLSSGGLVSGVSASLASSPETVTGSWGTGLPATGSTVLSAYVTGQTTGVKIEEIYLDVDTREAPTLTPQVLDGSESSVTTVSDTAQPTIRADSVDLDGLTARQYRYWVTLSGAIVWDTGVTSGPSANRRVTTALANGDYVAHIQVWSTLGASTAYASDEETLDFTVSVGTIDAPDAPVVTQVEDAPLYQIEVCAPDASGFDDYQAYVEIQRVDCPQGGYLELTGTDGSYASTPVPAGDPLVNLQVTVSAGRDDQWRPTTDQTLAAHYNSNLDNRAWRFFLDSEVEDPALLGRIRFAWSEDGTSTLNIASATVRQPVDSFGVATVRATLMTDDGAGGWSVVFEYLNLDSEWVQLGDAVTNSGGGTSSIFSSTAPYSVGAWFSSTVSQHRFTGRIYFAEVRDGPDGNIIADPDFTGHMAGTTAFDDDQGNTWTVNPPAWITSDQEITSIAILGPLDTDECATYTDYAVSRSGVGTTCTHLPDPCCSYYRARTVGLIDGSVQVSDWDAASQGTPDEVCLTWDDGYHLLRTEDSSGVLWMSVGGIITWDRTRPFTTSTGVMGTRFVTSATPGGRNLHLSTAVESEDDLAQLLAILERPLVLVSPSDSDQVWASPVSASVKIIKVGRIRQVTADFVATGPQPPPQLSDVGS